MIQVIKIVVLFLIVLISCAGFGGEFGVMQGMVEEHNKVREKVGSPGLVWSNELEQYAQQWANHLAGDKRCAMQHRPNSGEHKQRYGENLYWASPIRWSSGTRGEQQVTPAQVVQSWAGEEADYFYSTNSCKSGKVCGHFTQVVWKQTRSVGCGRAVCPDKSHIWVCNYDPPGNLLGQKPY